jgi:hypothetical protein
MMTQTRDLLLYILNVAALISWVGVCRAPLGLILESLRHNLCGVVSFVS